MAKPTTLIALAAVVALGMISCKKSPQNNPEEIQAKFRAEQKARAVKTYQELVKKYPDNEFATKAKERIRVLAPPAAPVKK